MSADDYDRAFIDPAVTRWVNRQIQPGALDRILAGALTRAEVGQSPLSRLRWGWLVTRAQIPIIKQRLIAASLMVVTLGAVVAVAADKGWPSDAFVLVAPLATAGAVAALFRDSLGELSLTLPASPRSILLGRLVVVVGIDLAATLLISVVVAGRAHEALATLVVAWLGPMMLLAATSLFVSSLTTATTGIAVAMSLWFVRILAGLRTTGAFISPALAADISSAWTTNLATIAVTVVLTAAAIVVAPRRWANAA